MKFSLTILLFTLLSINLPAQDLITGFVQNEIGEPVAYASVFQVPDSLNPDSIASIHLITNYIQQVDVHGAFHLVQSKDAGRRIEVMAPGYFSQSVNIGNREMPLQIALERDSSYQFNPGYNKLRNMEGPRSGATLTMNIDIINADFQAFAPVLGLENVSRLNNASALFSFGLSGTRKRLDYGIEWGILWTESSDPDSINIELNNTSFGLNVGYKIVNSKSFVFMPQVAWKRYRYRLINNLESDNDQPLNEFVNSPDLDLRIAQNTGFLGARLGYKYRGKKFDDHAYITFGIYGGYLLKFHKAPKVNGLRSILETDLEIDYHPISFGIFFSTNFEAEQ